MRLHTVFIYLELLISSAVNSLFSSKLFKTLTARSLLKCTTESTRCLKKKIICASPHLFSHSSSPQCFGLVCETLHLHSFSLNLVLIKKRLTTCFSLTYVFTFNKSSPTNLFKIKTNMKLESHSVRSPYKVE